jgi:hypothetical protein
VSLIGGIIGNITLPYPLLMGLSLTIFGNFMYQPDDVRMLVRMAETGSLSCEWVDIVAKFLLENWEEAWSTVVEKAGPRDSPSLSLKHEHERVRGEEHAVIKLGVLGFLGLVFTMRVNTLGRTQVTATGQNIGATASDRFFQAVTYCFHVLYNTNSVVHSLPNLASPCEETIVSSD